MQCKRETEKDRPGQYSYTYNYISWHGRLRKIINEIKKKRGGREMPDYRL